EEIRKIPDRPELLIGQKIVNRHPGRMSRELRSELFSRRARFSPQAQLNHEVRRVRDDFRTHLDHFDLRHAQSQPRRQTCCKHFVRQNPQMLRIVLEFDDVVRLIVATHQLGLRPAPHPPYMLDGKLHGRHASQARRNSQENCSATGSENCLTGILSNLCRNETGWGRAPKKREKTKGPEKKLPRPSAANLFTWKVVSAFCGAWRISWQPSWPVFSWLFF